MANMMALDYRNLRGNLLLQHAVHIHIFFFSFRVRTCLYPLTSLGRYASQYLECCSGMRLISMSGSVAFRCVWWRLRMRPASGRKFYVVAVRQDDEDAAVVPVGSARRCAEDAPDVGEGLPPTTESICVSFLKLVSRFRFQPLQFGLSIVFWKAAGRADRPRESFGLYR